AFCQLQAVFSKEPGLENAQWINHAGLLEALGMVAQAPVTGDIDALDPIRPYQRAIGLVASSKHRRRVPEIDQG
ncbi:MAG: hypothetical protein AAF647_09130, partial [Pseudomonadota bacterium]